MALAGDLKEIAFSDVAQLYSRTRRTAMLVVNRPDSDETLGVFYFDEGELVDARMGDVEGVEAVYKALELKEGTFRAVREVKCRERRIFQPLGLLLLQSLQRLDEQARPETGRPTTYTELDAEPDTRYGSDTVVTRGTPDPSLFNAVPEIATRVCLTCGKQYSRGDVCPDDGNRLMRNTGGPLSVQPPGVRPSGERPSGDFFIDPRENRRRVVIGVVGGLAMLGAFAGVLWVGIRANRPMSVTADEGAPGAIPVGFARSQAREGAPSAAISAPAASAAAPVGEPTLPTSPASPTVQPLTSERGVTDTEVTFGMVAPFSGPARELGRQMKIGIETAFSLANESGGVAGRQVRLETRDDGYEPARTVPAMLDLYEKARVFGIIGNVGTPNAALALPFALDRKMLFFGAFSGSSLLRRDPPDRYAFNFRASNAEETAALARYLMKVKHFKPEQIAVFTQQDALGDGGYVAALKTVHGFRGSEQADLLRVGYRRNTIDVTEAVSRILGQTPRIRAVIMVATYRAAAKFIEKVKEHHPGMLFANVSFVGSTSLAEELNLLGPRFAAGTIVTQVVPPVEGHSSAVLDYKAALAKVFPGEKPDYVSFEGYLTAKVLIEGLLRAGHTLDTEKLVGTLEGLRAVELGIGTPAKFNFAEHQASHKVWATQLDARGRYELLDLE